MAWRIHDSVMRGEIDNRQKGVVRGRIWLHGFGEPLLLELAGNAHADLAGCRLCFENPGPTIPLRPDSGFDQLQQGCVGDLTASRKVRVFDLPFSEAFAMIKRGEKPPEHMANSLYLEWFSQTNGRVVIEGADWKVDLSEPAWRLTPEDEEQRAQAAEEGMTRFLQRLDQAITAQAQDAPKTEDEWDEFQWERFLRESDARSAKYGELLEKFGDGPEAEERIAKEMGWDKESYQREVEEAQARGEDVMSAEEMNAHLAEADTEEPLVPDPLTEGVDWIRTGQDRIAHPLQHRCCENAVALRQACKSHRAKIDEDQDLSDLVAEFQITSAKLAGALNHLAYGRRTMEKGFIIAYLKRALDHLHAAMASWEKVAPKNLVPEPALTQARRDLFAIRQGILDLMQQLRGRG